MRVTYFCDVSEFPRGEMLSSFCLQEGDVGLAEDVINRDYTLNKGNE